MTDILYLAWNRFEFTKFSFQKLLENTDWNQIGTLFVHDDGSKDGTDKWLHKQWIEHNNELKCNWVNHSESLGGPVAVMNWYLDQNSEADRFTKIDSDIMVPPGWLQEMNRMMYLNPGLDILGMQPDKGPPVPGQCPRRFVEEASHIGGVGMMRKRAFKFCRPSPNGRFGWTEFQQRHPDLTKAWIRPDLAVFEMDRLPFEPWRGLSFEYVGKEWTRAWPEYPEDAHAYWDWAF